MTTLARDKARPFELGDTAQLPIVADDIVHEGAAVGFDPTTALARPLQAGDVFAGFAARRADNTGGAAGAVKVPTRHEGKIQLPIISLAASNVGDLVYASDDDTFTLEASGNSLVGRVDRFVGTGVGVVSYSAGLLA